MKYGTRLHIDLSLLFENFKLLKGICPNNSILFMVKADAYGHGMLPIVRFANEEVGINEFGCATLAEAVKLRDELSDLEFEIYVFSDINFQLQSDVDFYLNRRIIPVLSNINEVDVLLNSDKFDHLPLCLQINTGLNRLGIEMSDLEVLISKLKDKKRKTIYHLLTHLACSSNPVLVHEKNILQKDNFIKAKKLFIDSGFEIERTSISNSGAIEQGFGIEETHIRPGIMLYGPTSMNKGYRDHSSWGGKCISRLETYVLKVFEVKKGAGIGYESTLAPEDGTIVLLALGYGDGFSGRLRKPSLYHEDNEGYVLGRVNMDMTQVFFKGELKTKIFPGDKFTVWGHNPKEILKFSDQTKTITYENFCHLTSRVPRIYSFN